MSLSADTFKVKWTLSLEGTLTIHRSDVEELDDMELRDFLNEGIDESVAHEILEPQIKCAADFMEWAKEKTHD